ncbi:cell division protein ZipA [Oceanimonas doudoroffii]|uniref:Cell division protein ZipA n=1 Tax=Oceanimonas doudoroffii TaxID=84158 RepID=A0A233RIP9_9GAMM|nr:cell division protein ZipA [Oceanimonas doudoroffii]OXY83266.1 cell division protein ZipA [Oceanimonas doudoroffii]
MQDLRIILIILGAIAIAALLIHGLWTSQKERQAPMRNKPLGKVATEPAASDDFDQDGIGRVRVVSGRKAARDDDWQPQPGFSALDDDEDADEPSLRRAEAKPQPTQHQPAAASVVEEEEFDPLFDEPVRPAAERGETAHSPAPQAEPAGPAEPLQPTAKAQPQPPKAAPRPEPVVAETINEPQVHAEPAPQLRPEPQPVLREVPRTWQDVYVVNLMARPNQQIDGAALMRALTTNGFHFGEMDIFHHHQTPAGQGSVLFSLINMVKPGTFNPKAMSDFSTPGVSIFMQLPCPGMAKNQFNLMVQTAENLAEELDALLFDVERAPLSPDYLAHCREQLRDYDSQAQ